MLRRAHIISILDEIYLVIPQDGNASSLFMEQLNFFYSIQVPLKPFIHRTENILPLADSHQFCIELIGKNGSRVGKFIYELFEAYINANLEQEV